MAKIDLTEQKFGRLTVLKDSGRRSTKGIVIWECICDCGKTSYVRSSHLKDGTTQSCGCYGKEKRYENRHIKHGLANTIIYKRWEAMMARCYNPNNNRYHCYGAKGKKVCDRWHDVEKFYEDMGDPPTKKHSIGRIDNNGNYEPSNCRWELDNQQANNRSTNRNITYKNDTKTLMEWARYLNIPCSTLANRLKKMSIEDAFTKPKKY